MDKELAQLEEWGVNLINDYEEYLQRKGVTPTGPGGSEFKRIGRFSGELVANPEAYGELLEMARSQNMSGKQLVQAIRTVEDIILGQRQGVRDPTIRSMIEAMPNSPADRRQLMSDVIHHLFAQRTGGDTLRRLSQAERSAARGAIRDVYGGWGNVDENLLSLLRSWHTPQERAIGLEQGAIQIIGGDPLKAGQQGTKLIHEVAPKAISRTVSGTTATEVLPELMPQFEQQAIATQATLEEVAPVYQNLDELVAAEAPPGRDLRYRTGMPQADLELRRSILERPENQATVQDIIARGIQGRLETKGGSTRFIIDPEVVQQVMRFPNRLMQQVPQPIRRVVPGGAIVGGAMLYSDIAQAAEGVQSATEATDKGELGTSLMEATAGATAALSAAPGLQPLAIPSMVFGATAGAMRMRVTRDQERERTQQVMAGEVSRYGPTVTQTPTITKPESDYERRRRARTGR